MKLVFRTHALQRMFERRVDVDDVRRVVEQGLKVEHYPDDFPYPSCLMLGWLGPRPLHVVVAENTEESEHIIITVYEPDQEQWEDGFSRRKP